MNQYYFDYASAEPLRPAAKKAILDFLDSNYIGDPSRVHSDGRSLRFLIEESRDKVAKFFGVSSRQIIFTSGATESVHLATYGAVKKLTNSAESPEIAVISSAVEHSSVKEAAATFSKVVTLGTTPSGEIDIDELGNLLTKQSSTNNYALINCQYANHELGTVQPFRQVFDMAREYNILSHCDAAIAAGHVRVDFNEIGCDLMSISGHKMGAPHGIGVLIVKKSLRLTSLLKGGSQERMRRAGMENIIGILGFAAVCNQLEDSLEAELVQQTSQMRQLTRFVDGHPLLSIIGPMEPHKRLANLMCIETDGIMGEAVVIALDRAGISIHSGSSCSSEVMEPSPILRAVGRNPDTSIRVSFGWDTSQKDLDALMTELASALDGLKGLGR